MNLSKQKKIIENILSSEDILAKCGEILNPAYFDPEISSHIKFVLKYYYKYNKSPTPEILNAEFDEEYKKTKISVDEIDFTCEEIEKFCKQSAMTAAIYKSVDMLDLDGDDNKETDIDEAFGKIFKNIENALQVSIKKNLGINIYDNPEERLKSLLEELKHTPTLIREIDRLLGGGVLPTQQIIFSANSGGGKSVMLSNIGHNMSIQGKDVCYISLELPEDMIFLRQAFILSSVSHRIWKEKLLDIASKIHKLKDAGAGDFHVTRMPAGVTANTIRSYVKQYELQRGKPPDVLIVDYLDRMKPIGGTKNKGISEQDREKSEELYEILNTFNMMGFSASQQNRGAITMDIPDQSVIGGGLAKIDAVDAFISLYMSSEMRLNGIMQAFCLKSRYSGGAGQVANLAFNEECLRIEDHDDPTSTEAVIKKLKNKKVNKNLDVDEKNKKILESLDIKDNIDLPGVEQQKRDEREIKQIRENLISFDDDNSENNPEELMKLMEGL